MTADYAVYADVAVITIDNPPVNALGLATRCAIIAGIERALMDVTVSAVVLTGAGRAFSGGADIHEFDSANAFADPNLRSVIRELERSEKPIVAAVNGSALGGGLEIALGCHYRVVAPGTKLGLPEVKLGLVPGAGGTQLLPRAIGVEQALNLISSGESAACEVLAGLDGQRLIDKVATSCDTLLEEALAFARDVAGVRPLPLLRDLSCHHPKGDAYFQFARNMLKSTTRHFPAALRCVDAVEAATTQRFDAGLAHELEIFLQLLSSQPSRALRHAFVAERAAAKIADVPEDTPRREIALVAVIGAGTMGSGIALNFIDAGLPVILFDANREALDRGVATLRRHYDAQVKKGRLMPTQADERMQRLRTALSYNEIRDADLVIEAVFENLDVKRQVFEQLDQAVKPGAILASNTSTLDLNRIASFTQRPQDVVGLHFFSPANVMRLLEVVRGERTADDVLATSMALAKKIRKTAVVSGVCDGFIGNRMLEPYLRQAGLLLDQGVSPQRVDKAIEAFGFAMGPFRMSDMAGNDVGYAIRQRRKADGHDEQYSTAPDRLHALGRHGQKTGGGWYDYPVGTRDAMPSPVVEQMLREHRESLGVQLNRISDTEIVERLVLALVNEGARILEDGIAARAGDIDLVYLTGYGFPLYRGGPMFHASEVGLADVVRAMKRIQRRNPTDARFWEPASLLVRLADEGKSLR
ncbi:3-hydroxyacyl-CoA dehydrogenase [Burkholderia sp. Bp9140]|uniref:3-hydroxyacyl-CoA dehydrogenase NAD-binding domain-containing protein n=1 Tax=Burkholderia sp. Bp9140 TaxID=2184572 RepID=UPI000F568160|nr:3-hydroxyacyl-CoA dehydrogenase NAD-binding domain-containing protein [Burkholderia sp. Bp9140]RQR43653.1 3-hydroxyacyl-CoA dehydrogenase [Burkholderia sp. Bp9140]